MPRSSLPALDERLQAYFDGELDQAQAAKMAEQLGADPELAQRVDDLTFLSEMVRGTLEHESKALPQARFEQIWERFDSRMAREARLQDTAGQRERMPAKLKRWFAAVKVPLAVGAAAAVVVGVTVVGSNNGPDMASNQPASAPALAQPSLQTPPPAPRLAAGPMTPTPNTDAFDAKSNEADIEQIEFGGRSGTVSQFHGSRGTTTVIWVQEDDEPIDSERSL